MVTVADHLISRIEQGVASYDDERNALKSILAEELTAAAGEGVEVEEPLWDYDTSTWKVMVRRGERYGWLAFSSDFLAHHLREMLAGHEAWQNYLIGCSEELAGKAQGFLGRTLSRGWVIVGKGEEA